MPRHGSRPRGPRGPGAADARPGTPRRTDRDRRRELGQNFLVDTDVVDRMLAVADVAAGDLVVDLGAGRGALTGPLVDRGVHVVAVELDQRWVTDLRRRFGSSPHVEVVHADVLQVALPTAPFRVVANPPFGVTTSLLRRLLSGDVPLRDATVLLQLETARRLAGSPASGRFSLTWAPWFELRVCHQVDRRAFRPVPATDAAILTVRRRGVPWLSPARYADWTDFVDRAFGAPGRTAADRLDAALGRGATKRLLRDAEVDAVRPPSRLPAEAWLALFRALPADRRSGG